MPFSLLEPSAAATHLLAGFTLANLLAAGTVCLVRNDSTPEPQPAPVRVLAFGDSLIAGFGLPEAATPPARLEKRLAAANLACRVINAGVPGDTSAGGLARLEQTLAATGPDVVILELGVNDNLQGWPPEQTEANLDAMLTLLARRGISTLLAGVRPLRDLGESTNLRFQAIFPRLAARHGTPIYPDFLAGVAGNPRLLLRDGLHPNSKGAKEIVGRMTPLVTDLIHHHLRSGRT